MAKLIRSLLAILVATVLIGAPAVQAMITMPCQTVAASATDHQLSSAQAQDPMSAPCEGTMPGCVDMLGCGLNASLPFQVTTVAHKLIWISAAYQAVSELHEGLSVKPYLGPPITI